MTTYPNKPKEIKTVHDLIAFVEGIPAKEFCVDRFESDDGTQRCVLGHLAAAYLGDARRGYKYHYNQATLAGVDSTELVKANNGWSFESRRGIKTRILKFLHKHTK